MIKVLFASIGQYLNLDKDHNGMLSKEELSRYGTATLTTVFLDRVFQECLTYDGEMVQWSDLKAAVSPETLVLRLIFRLCLRTIKPTWTLCWRWKTGRSQQHYSIFSSFWT